MFIVFSEIIEESKKMVLFLKTISRRILKKLVGIIIKANAYNTLNWYKKDLLSSNLV